MRRVRKIIDKTKPLTTRQKVFKSFAELEGAMYFSRPPKFEDVKEFRGMRLSNDEVDNNYAMGEFLRHDYILVDRHSHERKTVVIEVDLHTLYPFNHFLVYKNDLPPDYYTKMQQIHLHHRPAPVGSGNTGLPRAFDQKYTIFSRPEHFSRSMFFMHDAPAKTLMDIKGSVMLEVSDKSLFMYDYSQAEPTSHSLQVFVRTACTIATLLGSRIK